MSISQFAARMLVQMHLRRRTMPAVLHDAMVETVQARIRAGARPYVTATMQDDIEHQAAPADPRDQPQHP